MLAMVNLIAGISWEPEIRGLLTVVLAFSILGGSVWLMLVTNTGTRLGSLIALAGFWGWMFVMGIFWWIYGIGWVGSGPAWEVQDIFADDAGAETAGISEAFIGNVGDLPDTNCFSDINSFPPADGVASINLDTELTSLCAPRAIELLMAYPGPEREPVIRELLNPQSDESKIENIVAAMGGTVVMDTSEFPATPDVAATLEGLSQSQRDDVFDAIVDFRYDEIAENIVVGNEALGPDDPRYLTDSTSPLTLQDRIDVATETQDIRIDDLSLSALKGAAPFVLDWAEEEGLVDFDGWNLQTASQSGEAAATADAFLREDLFPEGDFVVLDAFQQGGKEKRDGNGMWDRIWFKTVESAKTITGFGQHPTNYTVVNVTQTLEKEANPALPPPVPEADPDAETYSVVMTRNLGNLRLIPALFTLGSLVLFLLTCWVLHIRDLKLRGQGLDV